jgi:F-type H+-transporting ATPase subunit b
MLLATLLLAAPEEGPPPLIDVDGTLFIQWALFLILMFVAARFLFRPYLKLRDTRGEKTEGARHEATAMQGQARDVVANYEAALQRARMRGAEERQRLRSEGAAHERQVLGVARDESQKSIEAARLRISTEAAAARKQLELSSVALSRQIVKKVLGREVA